MCTIQSDFGALISEASYDLENLNAFFILYANKYPAHTDHLKKGRYTRTVAAAYKI